jgi:NAD(P)-dependent dehydrogenase (short-subunit alcohol dehydrogenase family)
MEQQSGYVLITGASSRIGESIARTLSKNRRLILHGRDSKRLEEIRASLVNSDDHLIWICDFQDPEGVRPSLSKMMSNSGTFVADLIHCAGIYEIKPMRMVCLADIEKIFSVNYLSAAVIVSTLLKNLVNSGHLQRIVFISSVSARFGVKGFSVYSASKAALDGMMRSLAVELNGKIQVNSILPGPISKEINTIDGESNSGIFKKSEGLKIGTPSQIAQVVEFLLSDNSSWITGQEIIVDGGSSIDATMCNAKA